MNNSARQSNNITEISSVMSRAAKWFSHQPLLVAVVFILTVFCTCRTSVARQPRYHSNYHTQCPPKILVLRGLMEVFSLGMNDLAKKLECRGYDVELTSWSMALFHAKCSDPRPIVVIGHSLGGRMCAWVSRKMQQCGATVPLIIIVDANVIQSIPRNVERCLHLYVTNELGIFHGNPVRPESLATDVVNWDVSRGQPPWYQGGVNHFDIDATPWVHDIIIREIAHRFPQPHQFAKARPARTRGNIALVSHEEPAQPTASRRRPTTFRSFRRRPVRSTVRGQGITGHRGVDGKSISIGSLGGP